MVYGIKGYKGQSLYYMVRYIDTQNRILANYYRKIF